MVKIKKTLLAMMYSSLFISYYNSEYTDRNFEN